MDKIFTIYFTTKPDNQGTGLGLHMCRYIIEESFGGSIMGWKILNKVQNLLFDYLSNNGSVLLYEPIDKLH